VSGARIVVVGSGGREHALAERLAESPDRASVIVMPGNDGIAQRFEVGPVDERDVGAVAAACRAEQPDLVVVGPEAPLAAGLADRLIDLGVPVFGPYADAARLESSKAYAKEIMRAAGVATAEAESFTSADAAEAALDRFGPPWVVKADGLAAGKGVCVTSHRATAVAFLRDLVAGGRGGAGRTVLLERYLDGEELSVMAVCDGERAVLLPAARDYKRALDGDEGPNTGGMGAVAPVFGYGPAESERVSDSIVRPVLAEMRRRGTPFRGVLYAGLMRTGDAFRVVEFNVRFGDPETQVVLPLIEGSLLDVLAAASRGALDETHAVARSGASVTVALVDERYPEAPSGHGMITGLEHLDGRGDVGVRCAGVRKEAGGFRIIGGRAAYVVASAGTVESAREAVYRAIGTLGGSGWRCRQDIGAGTARDARDTRGAYHGATN
jgi:phosphoribosylamine--glycine ligase